MSDVLGNSLKLVVFGESHGPYVGATISSLPSGIKVDVDFIKKQLNKRKANDNLSTQRQEDDDFEIISGVFNGYTTGDSLTVIVPNKKQHSSDYQERLIRPSHADYTAELKYKGFQDYRGGGHFSGRLTVGIVVLGAIIISYLESQGIKIGSHIKSIHNVDDEEVNDIPTSIDQFNDSLFPCVSLEKQKLMMQEIEKARNNQDSVGGIVETFVYNVPGGIGNPFFDSIESIIAHALFSIPGVKGVEFGLGFSFASHYGSEVNDYLQVVDNKIITKTNNNAGINGGITNGMPIVIKTVLKPTPSISKKQESISLDPLKNKIIEIHGRHDPCIVRRARVVIDSLVAFSILDAMLSR